MLPIDKIIADARTQVRAVIDDDVVEAYVQQLAAGAVFPPVVVFRSEAGTYLGDGFHRVAVHRRAGRSEIEADVRAGSQQDALWYALGANRTHGHRLTAGDKRHAVERALEAWPDKSQRRLAAQIGCSQRYVGKIRDQVRTGSPLSLPARTIGTDGKSYPAERRMPEREPGTNRGATIEDADQDGRLGAEEPTEAADELTGRTGPSTSGATKPRTGSEPPTRVQPEGTTGPTKQPGERVRTKSNRIVSAVASDAVNLVAQEYLIDFRALDRNRLAEWIADLEKARRDLGRLIRRLRREAGDDDNDATTIDDAGRA